MPDTAVVFIIVLKLFINIGRRKYNVGGIYWNGNNNFNSLDMDKLEIVLLDGRT
jgi:hypothetical protein